MQRAGKIELDYWPDPKTGEWIMSKGDRIIFGLSQLTSATMRDRLRKHFEGGGT